MRLTPPRSSTAPRLVAVPGRALSGADDASLARAAAEGHPLAASVIWDRFSPMVRRMLLRSLGPHRDVEDLGQEVFLRLFRQIDDLRDPGALKNYLIGITVRVVGSELRRRRVRRFLHLTDSGVLPEDEGVAVDHQARKALSRLYEILDGVHPEGRVAFVLRHFEGLELTEVAAAMDLSLATVKRRLSKVSFHVATLVKRDPWLCEYLAPGREALGHETES
jgi:RNA polymerase sigma-70 factor (ECF subfamily)